MGIWGNVNIGRYKLLEKLGEGGFGSVWAAEQREPVKRRVALKIIKLGMDTKQVVARFEAERQALAMMDHPNIAKVLDAGTTEMGRPYFVMELVKGIPITKYFEQEGTEITEKLRLFMKVCQAIQHAHQKGIIHRDIKPSNVMVTLHDGEPVPKVIDFGIAKATQGELTDKTIYTQYSQFIGTPAYMSPEQAEMSGLDIDTRSDVYSLGVLLYELLTGSTPFDSKELMASGVEEMRKIIRERDPVKPSTRLCQTLSPDSSSEKGFRLESLSNDLDWIVMKCLEKDRSRRYETANGLAMDIQRHLVDEPILARPPSLGYRLRKTYRRNKLLVGGVTSLAMLLFVGVIFASYSWQRETLARQESDVAKAEAEANQKTAIEAKEKAERYALEAKHNVYSADMNLAAKAFAENNLGKARRLLLPYLDDADLESDLGWEWRYLWNEVNSTDQIKTSRHHENAVTAVAFLGDSSRVVSGSYDGAAKIWDHTTGEVETVFQLDFCRVRTVAASRSGREIGVVWQNDAKDASSRHGLGILDTVSGRELSRIDSRGSGNQHRSIAFLEEGDRLISYQNGEGWRLIDWRNQGGLGLSNSSAGAMGVSHDDHLAVLSSGRRSGFQIIDLIDSSAPVEVDAGGRLDALAVSSTSGLVASGHFDPPVIKLFNARGGELVRELHGHTAWVCAVVFSQDGRWLYSASADQSIRIWDVASGELLKTYRGHTDEVWSLALSPDGALLASGSKDKSVRLWPALPSFAQDPIIRFLNEIEVPVITRAPDGDSAIVCGVDRSDPELVRFHEVGSERTLKSRVYRSVRGPVRQVALDWNSRLWMLTGEPLDWNSRLWTLTGEQLNAPMELLELDLKSGEVIKETRIDPPEDSFAGLYYPRSRGKVSSPTLIMHEHSVSSLLEWDGGSLDSVEWPEYRERDVFFGGLNPVDPDRCQVYWSQGGAVIVLNGETGETRSVRAHGQLVMGLAFSSDGRRIYSVGLDGYAKCWDVATMKMVGRPMRSQLMAMHSLGLSPDGRRLVTGAIGGRVTIWDPDKQRELGVFHFSQLMNRVMELDFLTNDILLIGGENGRRQERVWQVCRAFERDKTN